MGLPRYNESKPVVFRDYEEFLDLTDEEMRRLIKLADHACQLGIDRAVGRSIRLHPEEAVRTASTIIGHALAALASGLARITEADTIVFEPEAWGDMDVWLNVLVERKILESMPFIEEVARERIKRLFDLMSGCKRGF